MHSAGTAGAYAGAAGAGGDAAAAGGSLADLPLLPLVPEHLSKYVFTPIAAEKPMTDTCSDPMTMLESGEGFSYQVHTGTFYRTFCAESPFLIEGQGDDLTAYKYYDGVLTIPGYAQIRSPVEQGATWESGWGDVYTWFEVPEPVVTPAGSFENCWERQGSDTVITYCRGVGLVRAVASYANYQLDLVEKNF